MSMPPTLAVKSLSLAMYKVCLVTPFIIKSGPKVMASSLAGISVLAMPFAVSFATISKNKVLVTAFSARLVAPVMLLMLVFAALVHASMTVFGVSILAVFILLTTPWRPPGETP